MAIPNISTTAQALASYATQLQSVQNKPRQPDSEANQQEALQKPRSEQVTLSPAYASAEKTQASTAAENTQPPENQVSESWQVESPQEYQSATSKSITQALEAYTQASLI